MWLVTAIRSEYPREMGAEQVFTGTQCLRRPSACSHWSRVLEAILCDYRPFIDAGGKDMKCCGTCDVLHQHLPAATATTPVTRERCRVQIESALTPLLQPASRKNPRGSERKQKVNRVPWRCSELHHVGQSWVAEWPADGTVRRQFRRRDKPWTRPPHKAPAVSDSYVSNNRNERAATKQVNYAHSNRIFSHLCCFVGVRIRVYRCNRAFQSLQPKITPRRISWSVQSPLGPTPPRPREFLDKAT